MKEKTTVWHWIWHACDRVLLVVALLLLALGYGRLALQGRQHQPTSDSLAQPPTLPRRITPVDSPAISGTRVSLASPRTIHDIARDMLAADWQNAPSRPAFDMRERDGLYEIFCTLSQGIDKQGVKLTAMGHSLRVELKSQDGNPVMVHNFRLPYHIEQKEQITSSVSNRLLRISVTQAQAE